MFDTSVVMNRSPDGDIAIPFFLPRDDPDRILPMLTSLMPSAVIRTPPTGMTPPCLTDVDDHRVVGGHTPSPSPRDYPARILPMLTSLMPSAVIARSAWVTFSRLWWWFMGRLITLPTPRLHNTSMSAHSRTPSARSRPRLSTRRSSVRRFSFTQLVKVFCWMRTHRSSSSAMVVFTCVRVHRDCPRRSQVKLH